MAWLMVTNVEWHDWPEVIDPLLSKVGEDVGPRLALTLSHQIATRLLSLVQPHLGCVPVQAPLVPSETKWTIAYRTNM